MDLVERYLQAVKVWLPARQRDDIIAELAEDIRSEIEERESASGRKLDAAEVEALLQRRGRPILAAGRFRPQRSLIGPTLFPIYATVLKILAIPFLLMWTVRSIYVIVTSLAVRAESPVAWVTQAGSSFWSTALLIFGGVTLLFAILERVQARSHFLEKWNPRDLAPTHDPGRTPRSSSVTDLALQIAFALWWARPEAFFSLGWSPGSTWDLLHRGFFIPVLMLSLVTAGLNLADLMRPYWSPVRAGVKAAIHWANALIAALVLAQGWKTAYAEWEWVRQAPRTAPSEAWAATAVTDLFVYVCVAFVAFGAAIAFGMEVWRIVRLRKRERAGVSTAPHSTQAFSL